MSISCLQDVIDSCTAEKFVPHGESDGETRDSFNKSAVSESGCAVAADLNLRVESFLKAADERPTGTSDEETDSCESHDDAPNSIVFSGEEFRKRFLAEVLEHQEPKRDLPDVSSVTEADGEADGSTVNMINTGLTLGGDKSTSDCGELPHVSSTPLKDAVPPNTFPNADNALRALLADIAPIEPDNIFNLSSESEDTGSEGELAEDNSDQGSECSNDSDICGERGLLSDSVLERIVGDQPRDKDVSNDTAAEDIGDITDLEYSFTKAALLNKIKLYPDCDFSVNNAILDVMDLYLKNKLSKAGVSRTLQMVCKYLPDNHNLPSSSSEIFNYVQSLAPSVPAVAHYYCEQCLFYHGTIIVGLCEICHVETKFNSFLSFNLPSLIKFFFEVRDLASIIDLETDERVTDTNVLRDVRDGSVYKSINLTRGKYDLNLIFNTDGVRIRKGGKKELWPIMFTFAELPIRLQKSFLTVAAVWYDVKKPDMKTFLKPFVQSMEFHHHTGVDWIHPVTKEVHYSRLFLPVTVLDAPARAMIQNLILFNGKYGCNLCEIKLQLSTPIPGKKRLRIYNYVHNPILRTKERMWWQAVKATEENLKFVRGVRGPSVLSDIPSVDVSKCIVPEYMHSVLLGVVKQLTVIWTKGNGAWSIRDKMFTIDIYLKSFKHPDFVHRAIRQLTSLKSWKASDCYYFLLFEALPTLEPHLSEQHFQHFMLLVKGVFNLLKPSITEACVKEAELLLRLFVVDFGQLYGDRSLTHNVHQVLHLGMCVRRYGPLFGFSAFPYEDLNGTMSKTTHGTTNIEMEIVNNIKICQGIQALRNIVRGQYDLTVSKAAYSSGQLLGKGVRPASVPLSPEELIILHDASPEIFARARVGYDEFSSEIYKSLNSQNFYVMWTDNAEMTQYGSIRYFAHSKDENFIVIRLFVVDHTRVFHHKATLKCIEHFVPVGATNTFVAIRLCDIAPSIAKVGQIDSYVYFRPNLYHFVM